MAGKQIALLIGNGKFAPNSGFADLRCPANDVKAMRDLLQDKIHADFQVTSLVDATQQQITKAIYETLNSTAGFDDTVLIYYSGHGSPDDDGSLFLAANDSVKNELPITAVPTNFLYNRMRAAKSQRIFLILDCCFSGSIEKAFTKGEISDQVKTALPKQFSGSGSYVLTASTDTQLAEEKERDENSLLTKHILSGITDGTADSNDDGIVTIHELVVHVQQAVGQEGSQRPWGFELRAGGGEMVFANTGLARQAVKAKEVEEAVWKARDEYHVPMKTAQCIWSMISDEQLKKDGNAGRRRLNKLHSLIGDPSAFVSEIYELAEAAQRNAAIQPATQPAPERQPPSFPQTAQQYAQAEPPDSAKRQPPRPKRVDVPPSPLVTPPSILHPQQQFVQPHAHFSATPAEKQHSKWRPLIIAASVIGGFFVVLIIIGVAIGIAAGIKQGVNEPTSSTKPVAVGNALPLKVAGMAFDFSSATCGGTIYQTDDIHWMNALTGTCASGNGPVFQVEGDDAHVVLKGVNGIGYAYVPLAGGLVSISTMGPNGPWIAWGTARRIDAHAANDAQEGRHVHVSTDITVPKP